MASLCEVVLIFYHFVQTNFVIYLCTYILKVEEFWDVTMSSEIGIKAVSFCNNLQL